MVHEIADLPLTRKMLDQLLALPHRMKIVLAVLYLSSNILKAMHIKRLNDPIYTKPKCLLNKAVHHVKLLNKCQTLR